jgi:hypothetical protein
VGSFDCTQIVIGLRILIHNIQQMVHIPTHLMLVVEQLVVVNIHILQRNMILLDNLLCL